MIYWEWRGGMTLSCVNDGIIGWKSEAPGYTGLGARIGNLKTNIISLANIKLELAQTWISIKALPSSHSVYVEMMKFPQLCNYVCMRLLFLKSDWSKWKLFSIHSKIMPPTPHAQSTSYLCWRYKQSLIMNDFWGNFWLRNDFKTWVLVLSEDEIGLLKYWCRCQFANSRMWRTSDAYLNSKLETSITLFIHL